MDAIPHCQMATDRFEVGWIIQEMPVSSNPVGHKGDAFLKHYSSTVQSSPVQSSTVEHIRTMFSHRRVMYFDNITQVQYSQVQ